VSIYLIRHSLAVSEQTGLSDEQRYLSAEGRALARAVGQTLAARSVAFDALLTSPLVRAVQTAELVAQALGHMAPVAVLPALAPGHAPRSVAEYALNLGAGVALVGHEPGISALGALLLAGKNFPAMRPAQVVLIEQGRVGWTLDPTTLSFHPA
jgi:phosphohistidine phosphatase